jgi:oligoendopeptidase F
MPTPTTPQFPPPEYRFVQQPFDAGSLADVEPWFADLEQRPLADAPALERWLEDESELLALIDAGYARRYVAKTQHADDPAARERFLQMERDVMPRVKVLADRLDQKFLQAPARAQLAPDRYQLLIRKRENNSAIFRAENTALQAEDSELQTRQQALMASILVPFDGRELTLQQLAPYAESQDRTVRQRAYFAGLAARRAHWDELEDLYDRMVALRTQMGRNAGFPGYTAFRFRELQRFDYDESLCLRFHDAVERAVVPAVARLDERRQRLLGVPTLRPWDLDVDPAGNDRLRPFASEAELIDLARRLFEAVDPRFATEFDVLRREGLLDLMSRKGKAPGGYQYNLEDVRLPFVFMNAAGTHADVQTLLHEGGHSFHALLSRHHPLVAYRNPPIEFAETASMSMELLGLEHIGLVYPEAAARRAVAKHFETVLRLFLWIASIDAFQHQVYAQPGAGRAQRRAAWLAVRDRFATRVDWSGLDDARAQQWTAQTHLFTSPLYYVEYGIAQIAALQVWQRFRADRRAAVAAYRDALALGGSRPMPELFATAGVRFDVSVETLQELVAEVLRVLEA